MSMIAVAVTVVGVTPFGALALGGRVSFVPAMIATVGTLDLLSTILLLRQFRISGDRRALVLATSYVFSLAVLAGYAAAFPGVLGDVGPLGSWPSTAPWLWVAWHTGFPVLLAAAVAPWPRRWTSPAAAPMRSKILRRAVLASVSSGALVVLGAVTGEGWLATNIDGLDTSGMTRIAGPVILPVVAVATVLATVGAAKLAGPVRWAALASAAALGDVVLTLSSLYRYSLGWYVGRSLTILSCAVVLVAMLAEFGRLSGKLAQEADTLRAALRRTEELESLRATLLNHMTDGVVLEDGEGRIIAANPAATTLLSLAECQLQTLGQDGAQVLGQLLRSDETPWLLQELPNVVTRTTGEPRRDEIVGLTLPGEGGRRWLRVSTSAERAPDTGEVRYVVSSMTDETARHEAVLAARHDRDARRRRVQAVLDAGGPRVVVQPIVHLGTGAMIGGEALSRFDGEPRQGPDRWFADAVDVGLGLELELSAVNNALALLAALPPDTYLSVNVSAVTASSASLFERLVGLGPEAHRVVLELTEHAEVADYTVLQAALATVRSLGVKVAVDDTGTGFASLSHILALRPDLIKLDIDLVRGIHTDPARRALAEGLLVFAHHLGAELVAEGIETADELAALLDIGVTYGQGYHLAMPAAPPFTWAAPLNPTHSAMEIPCQRAIRSDVNHPAGTLSGLAASTRGDVSQAASELGAQATSLLSQYLT